MYLCEQKMDSNGWNKFFYGFVEKFSHDVRIYNLWAVAF